MKAVSRMSAVAAAATLTCGFGAAAPTQSNSGLARTGASVGILAALGAGVTALGGGLSYLRTRA